jgi:hypothetical protein
MVDIEKDSIGWDRLASSRAVHGCARCSSAVGMCDDRSYKGCFQKLSPALKSADSLIYRPR